jgi:hypothetical protein
MADDNSRKPIAGELDRTGRLFEGEVLDRELDMALAKYAGEARPGLEERILATVKAERVQAVAHGRWYWPKVAALVAAVVIVVAASLVWRSWTHATDTTAHNPSSPVQEGKRPQTGPNAAYGSLGHPIASSESKQRDHGPHVPVVVAAEPRLEQFPSPRPLSDQEKILASYVTKYPEHAILIAQARAEALRRDAAELETGQGTHDDSQQQFK